MCKKETVYERTDEMKRICFRRRRIRHTQHHREQRSSKASRPQKNVPNYGANIDRLYPKIKLPWTVPSIRKEDEEKLSNPKIIVALKRQWRGGISQKRSRHNIKQRQNAFTAGRKLTE